MFSTILIRVDASVEIGYGHISRCIVLAEALKNKFNITFVSKLMPKNFIQRIICSGFTFIKIDNNDNFEIFENNIVILDGYSFNSNYQKKIKSVATKLVCIDELRDIFYSADVIINNQPCLSRKNFSCDKSTKIYTGINFSLLQKEFISLSKKSSKLIKNGDKKIFFVCFGGSDPYNFTKKVVEILLKEITFCNINIVLGGGYEHKLDFKSNQVNIFKSLDAKNLIKLIKKSDIAILPASTIMLEAFCVGIPVISGWFDDIQENTLECLQKSGLILNCGDYRGNFNKRLLDLLKVDNEKLYSLVKKQKSIDFDISYLNEIFSQ
jgi:UDP-2,4-diacetamido-2,4,6-trideoxy-beta-L-altropyranose hydrolase